MFHQGLWKLNLSLISVRQWEAWHKRSQPKSWCFCGMKLWDTTIIKTALLKHTDELSMCFECWVLQVEGGIEGNTVLGFLLLFSQLLWYSGTFKKNAKVIDYYGPVCSFGNRRSWAPVSGFVSSLLNEWFRRDLGRVRERLVGDSSAPHHSFSETDSGVFYWQIIRAVFPCEEKRFSFPSLPLFYSFLVWKRVYWPPRNSGSIAEERGKD